MDGVQLVAMNTLDDAQVAELADLHRDRMPTSSLSRLGPSLTRDFYSSVRTSAHLFGVAALVDARVRGGVVGTPRPNEAFDEITAPLASFVLRVLRERPRLLLQLAWSKLRPVHDVARPPRSAELLYIFTDRSLRGRGVGQALLTQFFDEARAKDLAHVTLSVEIDNDAAIRLYEKRGFEIVAARRREGAHLCHRMSAST